jgi:succinoglycan biosynthesis transport protein ExoP
VTERTVILPPRSPNGGSEANYRLTVMIPKRQYLAYLRERWWVVVVTVAVALGAVLARETLRPESYSSYAQLYTSGEVQLSFASVFSEESQTYFGTQIELLKSARLQGAALDKIGYAPKPGEQLPVKVDISQPMKTSILLLQATGGDPTVTQRFLQALIDEYLAYKKETRRSTSEDIVASLTDQLTQKEKDLKSEQDKLAEFQRTNNVAVLEEEGKSAGLYLADLNLQLAKLKLDRELLANGLSPTTNQVPLALPAARPATNAVSGGTSNQAGPETGVAGEDFGRELPSEAALKSARVELAVKRAERDNVLSERGEMAARRLDDEVARLGRTIAILEQQSLQDQKARLEALDKRIAAMEASIPALEAKVLRVNERLSDAQRLRNNIQREQGFYDHLLGTLQNVDLGKNVQQERLSILQAPTVAVAANRYVALRICLVLAFGALVGLGAVFCWYLLDDRFVSIRDIKDQFGDMVLGLVPQIRVPRSQPAACVLQPNDRRAAYKESYRHLRSALLLSPAPVRRTQTLLITGAGPAEGKTTIAVNLARVLAQGGLRVILVDADLHSEGCKRLLASSAELGVLDYLRGEADVTAITHETELPGLSFIPAGTGAEHGDGLFLGQRLPELMKDLRDRADFVILDGAPILSADNSGLLAPHSDNVLLVVRPFFSRARLVRQALDMLYQRQAKQVAIVLNRARKDDLAGHYVRNGMKRTAKNGHVAENAKC